MTDPVRQPSPKRPLFEEIRARASAFPRRIVYSHPRESRVLEAVVRVQRSGLARPVLVGNRERLVELGRRSGIDVSAIQTADMDPDRLRRYAQLCLQEWRSKGLGEAEAGDRLLDPVDFSVAMVRSGDADGAVTGPGWAEADSPGAWEALPRRGVPFAYFLEQSHSGAPPRARAFVVPLTRALPTALELAAAAEGAASWLGRLMGPELRFGYLALGVTAALGAPVRFKSAEQALEDRVGEAVQTLRARKDTIDVSERLYGSLTAGRSGEEEGDRDVFVFASRSGAALHALRQRLGDSRRIIGPLLGGLEHPVNVVSSASSVDDVVEITAITCLGS